MDIKEAIAHALRGNSVLFTGAGFSIGALNSRPAPSNGVPTARQFATSLARSVASTKEYDLPIISQYFIKKRGEHELVREIISSFSVVSVSDYHKVISRIPWRRVYTTNYDNCFEFSAQQQGIDWTPITLDAGPSASPKRCVHINGHIFNLNINTLQSQIKLTHSSYSSDNFASSRWSSQFRQDLGNAKSVIFIGYSMYDLDIARVLFQSPELKERTFFIVSPSDDDITISPLEDYGSVLPIGIESLATLIGNTQVSPEGTAYRYTWLSRYNDSINLSEPNDKDGIDLITLGVVNQEALAWELIEKRQKYAIRRSAVDEFLHEIERGRRWFLVHSELGNGKTIVKGQLSYILTKLDFTVFWDTEFELNRANDIRYISKESGKIAIFIDETPDRFEVIDGILSLNLPNVYVFVCVRTAMYELGEARYDQALPEEYIPIDLNQLSDSDIHKLAQLMNNLGLWGSRADLALLQKESFIRVECDRRIARVILSVFEESEVGHRIVRSARRFMNDRGIISALVVLTFLLSRIGHAPRPTLLSEILNEDVWKILKTSEFRQAGEFLRFNNGEIGSRSSIISTYLLRNAFSPENLLWHIERFVRRLNSIKRDSIQHNIFTELQRFPVLESIIESPRKRELIIGYFQSISELSNCQSNGSFWLHYAMARLSFGEFKESELYFEQARSLAKNNPKVLTDIDNHFARLLIDSRIKSEEYSDYFEAFSLAHKILIGQINLGTNKHFPFRQAKKYVEFISYRKDKLSNDNILYFITCCRQVLTAIDHLTGPIARSIEVSECKESVQRAISIAQNRQD